MTRAFLMLAVAGGFVATPALASQNCADFQILGEQSRVDYNPFAAQPVSRIFQVRVRRLDPTATSVRFLLVDTTPSPDGPRVGGGGPGIYDIEWSEQPGREVFVYGGQLVAQTNGALVAFGGSTIDTAVTTFRLQVPRGQASAVGLQTEALSVRYQCYSGTDRLGPEGEQISADMSVVVNVQRFLSTYVGGVGQQHGEIAFGTLSPDSGGLSKAIAVTALSTVPYDVLVTSDNLGLLKKTPDDAIGIGYRMRYAGVAVLPGDTLSCPATPAPLGKTDQMEVALDRRDLGRVPAGDYRDVITLTFTPRDGGAANPCHQ